MQNNEEFGEFAGPSMYPLFHEAVALPIVKEWLDWDEQAIEFQDADKLRMFYSMLVPIGHEGHETPEPKIRSYIQVRQLRDILPKADARRLLVDEERPFEDALAAAKREEFSRLWAADITDAIEALENMGVEELKGVDSEGIEILERLRALIDERLQDYQSLTKTKSGK